jgi:hypothetical protein
MNITQWSSPASLDNMSLHDDRIATGLGKDSRSIHGFWRNEGLVLCDDRQNGGAGTFVTGGLDTAGTV